MGKDGTTGKIFSRQNFRDLNHANRIYGSKYIGVLRIAIRRSPEEKKLDRPILTGLGRKRISPERRFPRRETEKRQGASTYPDRWGPVHRSTPPLFFLSSFLFFLRSVPTTCTHAGRQSHWRASAPATGWPGRLTDDGGRPAVALRARWRARRRPGAAPACCPEFARNYGHDHGGASGGDGDGAGVVPGVRRRREWNQEVVPRLGKVVSAAEELRWARG